MKLTTPFADYPHIRKAGSLYFLAGQGCRNPETNEYAGIEFDDDGKVMTYNLVDQAKGVFQNIDNVLNSAGLSRANIVDVTVFLTTMHDFDAMNKVWDDYFKEVGSPTRTTVAVKHLPGHNFIEMKVIASE